MQILLTICKERKQLIILFLFLLIFSLLLFFPVIHFDFINDDSYLLWVSKFHPDHFGIYWAHPATVFEFFVLVKLFGTGSFAFNIFGIVLRGLAALTGYIFIAKITKSKIAGIVFSFLFITSYIGLQSTTWASAHVALIDTILVTITSYFYLVYLSSGKKSNFIFFSLFFVLSLLADPGRDFPVIGFLLYLFLNKAYSVKLKHFFANPETRKIAGVFFAHYCFFYHLVYHFWPLFRGNSCKTP